MAARPDDLASPGASADPNAATVPDADWPVPDLYDVQPGDDDAEVARDGAPRRRAFPFPPRVGAVPLIVVAALAAALAGVVLAASYAGGDDPVSTAGAKASSEPRATTPSPSTSTSTAPASKVVADVVGDPYASAKAHVEADGLRARVRFEPSDRPNGEVLRQSPPAGAEAEPGSVVVLTVSSGPRQVAVPDVEGLTAHLAGRAVRKAGLALELQLVQSGEPEGTVLAQTPEPGAALDPGQKVSLRVSAGQTVQTEDVPDLEGLAVAAARGRLRSLGLRSTVTRVSSSEPAGTVVGQSPGAGAKLRAGGTVRLRVSSGAATVVVADVRGLDEDSARSQLGALGFDVQIVDEPTTDPDEDGLVVAQDPSGGTDAEKGATVALTVARFG